jgi:hypothetical protein
MADKAIQLPPSCGVFALIISEGCFIAGFCVACMALFLRKDRSTLTFVGLVANLSAALLWGFFIIFMLFFFGIPPQS